MAATFLCFGPSALDIKGYTPQPFTPGIDSFGDLTLAPGGVSRNIAENLARLGAVSALLTLVGDDAAGTLVLEATRQAGVDTSGARRLDGQHTAIFAAFGSAGQHEPYILYNRDIEKHYAAEYLRAHAALIEQATCALVHTGPHECAAFKQARDVFGSRTRIGLTVKPAEAVPDLLEAFALADWIFLNRNEASGVFGTSVTDASSAVNALRGVPRRPRQALIVTLGVLGCVVASDQGIVRVCGPERAVIDPIGAGDAFTAAFALKLIESGDSVLAAQWGAAAASLAVECAETVWPGMSVAAVAARVNAPGWQVEILSA